MNRSDEDLADAILAGLPRTLAVTRQDAMWVIRCVRRQVPMDKIRMPNVKPYVIGQMVALCAYNMGPKPVCRNIRYGSCRFGPCCRYDHLGLPDEAELYEAMSPSP